MNILLVHNSTIPVIKYGGTERAIWYLGKELKKSGHQVTYLVPEGSTCPFAKVKIMDDRKPLTDQIPERTDIIHFYYLHNEIDKVSIPYVVTVQGNVYDYRSLPKNTIFVSKNHAARYGSKAFVYNGMDWDDYGVPDLRQKRPYYHFLGDAAWKVKNVQGAINIVKSTKRESLKVLGGYWFNFRMGIRFTFSRRVGFEGMVVVITSKVYQYFN